MRTYSYLITTLIALFMVIISVKADHSELWVATSSKKFNDLIFIRSARIVFTNSGSMNLTYTPGSIPILLHNVSREMQEKCEFSPTTTKNRSLLFLCYSEITDHSGSISVYPTVWKVDNGTIEQMVLIDWEDPTDLPRYISQEHGIIILQTSRGKIFELSMSMMPPRAIAYERPTYHSSSADGARISLPLGNYISLPDEEKKRVRQSTRTPNSPTNDVLLYEKALDKMTLIYQMTPSTLITLDVSLFTINNMDEKIIGITTAEKCSISVPNRFLHNNSNTSSWFQDFEDSDDDNNEGDSTSRQVQMYLALGFGFPVGLTIVAMLVKFMHICFGSRDGRGPLIVELFQNGVTIPTSSNHERSGLVNCTELTSTPLITNEHKCSTTIDKSESTVIQIVNSSIIG